MSSSGFFVSSYLISSCFLVSWFKMEVCLLISFHVLPDEGHEPFNSGGGGLNIWNLLEWGHLCFNEFDLFTGF